MSNQKIHLVTTGRNTSAYVERYMRALLGQTGCEWTATIVDDASTDDTRDKMRSFSDHPNYSRIEFVLNDERRGGWPNLLRAILACDDDEVVVLLDGDDFFAHDLALARIAREFENPDCWVSYGSFLTWPDRQVLYSGSYSDETIRRNSFRDDRWLAAHPRAFRSWLFKRIPDEDHRDDNGKLWESAWDQHFMLSILEMAGVHSRHIPDVLAYYETNNSQSHFALCPKIERDACSRIRRRPKKQPLFL